MTSSGLRATGDNAKPRRRRIEDQRCPETIKQERAMREQTLGYIAAVLRAHPELAPQEPPEVFIDDPYPKSLVYVPPMLSFRGLHTITADVSRASGVPPRELCGNNRSRHIVRARWECFARARAEGYSLPMIGRYYKKDHTTVFYALWRMGLVPSEAVGKR